MEVLLYFGLPTKNEHDDFSCPQKFIAYPQPHEILKCHKIYLIVTAPFSFIQFRFLDRDVQTTRTHQLFYLGKSTVVLFYMY